MKYITLTTEEHESLELLYKKSTDNLVKKRSHCLLLSHQKRTIADLMKIFNVSRRTIEPWFDGGNKEESILSKWCQAEGSKPN